MHTTPNYRQTTHHTSQNCNCIKWHTPMCTFLQFGTVWNIWNSLEHLEQFGTIRNSSEQIASRTARFGTDVLIHFLRMRDTLYCFLTHAFVCCDSRCLRMVRQWKNGGEGYVPLLIASFTFTKGKCQRKGVIGAKRSTL